MRGLGRWSLSVSVAALGVALVGGCATELARGPDESAQTVTPADDAYVAAYRRLTESQYRHAIADVFGADIQINARFEPEIREERLQAVGNARASVTTSGLEQYYAAARSIADQAFDEDSDLLACAETGAACASSFIAGHGEKLFRRALDAGEIAAFQDIYAESAGAEASHTRGMKSVLVAMLMSPEFLFRVERAEPDPSLPGAERLDAWSKASRISYVLWDAAPDAELMDAARTGAIHDPAVLQAQVERMIASPRMEDGVRAFFSDMLQFEYFDTLAKDSATYPKFSQSVADSAREETLRFLVNLLVREDGDYRDIFTSRQTEIDRTLAYVYNVPFLSAEPWAPYEFAENSERSGVVSQVTFLSLFAHPAASSPTIRGVKLQEIFRCLEVPLPPPDVDFSKVQALEHGTVRVRLTEHMTNPGCAGCHMLTDPMGLALERFDGLGQHRLRENGEMIDVRSEVEGRDVVGAPGVGQFLHDDPETAACLVRNVYYYGVGRPSSPDDEPMLARKVEAFGAGGYRLSALFTNILTDPAFYRVITPELPRDGSQTARLTREVTSEEARHGQSF